MEGKMAETALSWQEVQDICVEMEKLYRKDAQKDAKRLRALKQKRVEIAVTVESKQTESKKQLQHLLSNLREWEQHEAATKTRHEQVLMKLQELDTLKREMNVQLERLREDKQLAEQSLEQLLDKYEEIRLQIAQYSVEHQNDIPLAKHQMSLYASVTGIKWDFSSDALAGDIIVPAKQLVARFELDPATEQFDAATALWDKIDAAFEDIDKDL
uniref:Uncharacterized protein n=1 Tax=Globisporangium ultimum (strain ATCC 200006 / CBS 805.95 / DAOM BR144) TaxID=431595 RepID=K3WLF5_GLOUD